jgi:RimJ/RimL family protein N-acetyltransferase
MPILLPRSLSGKEIEEAIRMDHLAFPPKDQITRERAEAIYLNAPDSLAIWASQEGEWLGYASSFALSRAFMESALREGRAIYERICAEDVKGGGRGDLYVHSLLLRPELQGKGHLREVKKALLAWLERRPGFSRAYADAVSAAGERALASMGFEKSKATSHGIIMQAAVEEMARRLAQA